MSNSWNKYKFIRQDTNNAKVKRPLSKTCVSCGRQFLPGAKESLCPACAALMRAKHGKR